ncbi:unnamed protein product [Ixodes pacificus]
MKVLQHIVVTDLFFLAEWGLESDSSGGYDMVLTNTVLIISAVFFT